MRTIDHTLLKLETRPVQVDDLCAEARVDGFAVRESIYIRLLANANDICVHRPFAFDRSSFNSAWQTSKDPV